MPAPPGALQEAISLALELHAAHAVDEIMAKLTASARGRSMGAIRAPLRPDTPLLACASSEATCSRRSERFQTSR
ncbi:hypothetical protein GCM10009429_13100 [Dyella marensis]